jgi:Tol biopolymer transport system component
MEFAFPSLGVGSVRLNGDGFDPDNHRVVLSKSGSADIVLTPLSTGVISTVQTLFFQFTGSPDPGTYDVAVRWRDPSEDAVGDPALKFTVLGPPVIDTVSPTTARPLQIIKLDGKNFGTEASQITVNFVDIASSVTTGNNPVRVDVTEVVGDDQVGFLWARPDLSYIDPVPGTEEKEDMTVQVTVTTPEGTSAPSTFTISEEAEPEFSRELTFPALTLQEMIDYANQDPAPVGEIMAMIVCDVPATCMGSPSMNGRCGYTYPESWIPEPNPLGGDDIGTNGVSLPPGRPAAPGSACNPCDLTGPLGCTEVEGPISWEDIPADNIADNLVFRPEADSPGDIDLSSVTPGTALKGPDVVLDFTPLDGNPNGKIIGGGFVIEGDGKDSTRLRITSKGTMTVDPAEGTVITITDAHDVELNIDINGAPADVGVHIIRSRNIRISGKIKNCVDGIIIEDSENCNIALEVVGCETGITIDGGGLHFVRDTSVGYEFDSMTSTFTVPEGQVVGVVLEGGTAGNEITLIDVVGMQTGIQLDACEDNIIIPQAIGVVINPLASAIQVVDAVGASLSNDVGILLNEGATNNTIRGFGVFGIPTPLGNNDIGILIDGGDDNFLGNLRIGYNNDPGRISDPEDGIGNNMGMVLRGDSDGNTIIGNAFGGNVMFGLVVEPVTGTNNIEQNFFGTVPGLFGAEDLDPNGMAAMAFQSVSDIQTVQRNTFRGETVGISVDDSRDLIFTANTFSEIDEIGIALSMSQNLSFTKDFICGGPFDLLGFCDSTMPDGDVGIVANSSGGLRFSEVVIEGIDGDGIEFDQPPVGGGPTRVEGTVDQGSIIADPIRENPFDALNEPPNERVTGGSAVVITKNTGNGIVIRDGASDIGLIGLSIIENGGNGVLMDNAGANISIEESEITMNDQVGISVNNTDAGSTTIGSPGRGNTINENAFGGIFIISSSQATVQGNFIGSNGDPSGHGIRIFDSHDLLIGGLGGNEPNLISGNGLDGIRVTGPPDGVSEPILIQGNFIGTDETGATAMANSGSGIYINDCGSPTLATIEIDSNLIAGNSDRGITVSNCGSATRVVMEGNLIGRSLPPGGGGAGITGVSNSGSGVAIDDADQVRVTGNSVGFNGSTGITISDSSATVIHDNFIDANTGRGLLIDAQSKDSSVDSNIITGHSGDGIRVANLSRRNRLTRNSIYSNGGEAINLVSGGNSSIVAPNLSAINKDKTRYNISGRIPSNVPDGSRVELFASDDDEAQYFLGESFTLNNLFSFYNVPPPTGVSLDGKTFRATVTDLAGNTSELGELGDPLPPFVPPFCLPSELDDFNFIVASVNNGEINLTNVSNCDTITTWTENLAVDSAPSVRQVSDTRLLVFSSDRDTGGTTDELYLDDGGSSLTRLTDNTIDDLYPTISPDGTQLLYSAEIEAGNFEIQSLPITGGTPTRLTTNPSLDTTPVWHPDGERFYFVSSRDGNPAIYSQTLTDAAIPLPPTKLTSLAGTVGEPDVSPDGSMIAFQYTPPSALGAQVGLLDLNTIEVRLLETGGRTDLSPVWFETTSGELFLITASSPTIQTVPTQLYLLTTDGYPLAVLTDTDGGHTAPSCCWNGFDLTP